MGLAVRKHCTIITDPADDVLWCKYTVTDQIDKPNSPTLSSSISVFLQQSKMVTDWPMSMTDLHRPACFQSFGQIRFGSLHRFCG